MVKDSNANNQSTQPLERERERERERRQNKKQLEPKKIFLLKVG